MRNKLYYRTEAGKAHDDQHDPGHKSGNDQPIYSMNLHNAIYNYYKCAGRTTNLHPASAHGRNNEPGNDGSV